MVRNRPSAACICVRSQGPASLDGQQKRIGWDGDVENTDEHWTASYPWPGSLKVSQEMKVGRLVKD